MSKTIREISLDAAKNVFGEHENPASIALRYIEPHFSRLSINYQIAVDEIPKEVIGRMAECAGWYVSDNRLHVKPSEPTIGDVRNRIAEHVLARFPQLCVFKRGA